MQELVLKLTIDEANVILEGLGNLPFAKVYGLISKIQTQAGEQFQGRSVPDAPPTVPTVPAETAA